MVAITARVVTERPAADAPIDRAHLRRATFGDVGLERELLRLFDRQAEILIARMREADAGALGMLAHTLKGSAAGIGAGGVARAAEAIEQAAAACERAAAIEDLAREIDAARIAIAELLGEGTSCVADEGKAAG